MKHQKIVRTRTRPKLPLISEEMKQWAALLSAELTTWPDVSTRPMFGLIAFYRGDHIFAAVPHTRAVNSPNSIMLKLKSAAPRIAKLAQSDSHLDTSEMSGSGWLYYELQSAEDINHALRWLERAYEAAKRSRKAG
jgi:hypothetical protein